MMPHKFARAKFFDPPESNLFQAFSLLIACTTPTIAQAARDTLVILAESMTKR
jgi:hypothetical protein